MGLEQIAIWFVVAVAAAASVGLVVRKFRETSPRGEVVRRDRELALARASRPPRRQHYQFAHVLLRDAALADPRGTWDRVTSPRHEFVRPPSAGRPGVGDFLVKLWIAARDDDEDAISPEGLRVDVDGDVAVVTLPPPARIAEAYMIALVREPPGYFVLERGASAAFVAEWRKDMRIRMGDVPIPTRRELVHAVRAAVRARG